MGSEGSSQVVGKLRTPNLFPIRIQSDFHFIFVNFLFYVYLNEDDLSSDKLSNAISSVLFT